MLQGRVQFYLNEESTNKIIEIKKLKKGQYFGASQFFTQRNVKYNVRSVDFTTILTISRYEFLNLLQEFPQDYEKFAEIKDRIIYNDEFSQVGEKCNFCKSSYHEID